MIRPGRLLGRWLVCDEFWLVCEEAVFSSSEDRIRAGAARIAVAGHPVVLKRASSRKTALQKAGLESDVSAAAFSLSRFYSFTHRSIESLFSVLFPSDCRICAAPLLNVSRLPVCLDCLDRIQPLHGNICSICGERVLSTYAEPNEADLTVCPVCRRIDRPFVRAVAYGSYDTELRELVHLLKYNGVRPAAHFLGLRLAETIAAIEPGFEQATVLVIPVPLYKGKTRQRQFNQAELIARAALKACALNGRLQLATGILQRTRDTLSQIGLTSHQRRENLRGAFAVPSAAQVTGREILLVDDVYTTGTTVSECARVLRKAGAAQVCVATVARTLKLASKYQEIETDGMEAPVSAVG